MEALREFFYINRVIVLFVYGLTFFIMGLTVFLNARRHQRLRLARNLRWLAAFGMLHGLHEWGAVFIPIQASYLPDDLIGILQSLESLLLALSFICLLIFGMVSLEERQPSLRIVVSLLILVWALSFVMLGQLASDNVEWNRLASISARYLLCLPGALLSAWGLYYQSQLYVSPLQVQHILRSLWVAVAMLVAYAFFAGAIVPRGDFFPSNLLNHELFIERLGIPVQVLRSIIGFFLAVNVIRALEVFEIAVNRRIEQMEVEQIQAAEQERIGQEIHDGAIQGVYSASLILESMEMLIEPNSEAARRLNQARQVLSAVNMDLRGYMVSLRTTTPTEPLVTSLRQLIHSPRFRGLLEISLEAEGEVMQLKPMAVHHLLAIAQEALANTLKHAQARHAWIRVRRQAGCLCLTIEDDGQGFDSGSTSAGYGLRSMRDRARLLGGQLEVTSEQGQGTHIGVILAEDK